MSPATESPGRGRRAVILVSGGLDSTTVLAMALRQGYECYTLSFDYGQRHRAELVAASRVSAAAGDVQHKVVTLNLDSIGGSALTDPEIAVPEEATTGIPVTYVPARNTVFLSIALGWAEVLEARDIFIGVNAVDYSGYPDCRPDYIAAFEEMANLATRAGVEGHRLTIHTPLMHLSKAEIIAAGIAHDVDYSLTVSCYQATDQGLACGRCDACRLRRDGFLQAGVPDPTRYRP
ncbi:MAG: 7-cyano-7-deazaguanine synthase QueC [Haliea sp.]|jgi:7-cyano-7-deazaguanine synthase|uniref:7-cyano-7-deazaguanine synthase QueC n=1 Tax=Haliea sp. TaxID=1932666 RepID=UPI000C3CE887|nr:7-cyano-7-deazaguanine synthase QueC [Haliea sp.]MBM69484.1 7-cyano-7-deazaguanine synthase QueC [Haliea sp.]|tara:strand:+ start:2157 stop:2858 length:702 start_codon:yes stop_codon:yes gene_type:complete